MIAINSVVPYLIENNETKYIIFYDSNTGSIFSEKDIEEKTKNEILYSIQNKYKANIKGFDQSLSISAIKIQEEMKKTKDHHVINRGN